MAGRRTRGVPEGLDASRAAARAAAIADQLHTECGLLVELYVSIFDIFHRGSERSPCALWER